MGDFAPYATWDDALDFTLPPELEASEPPEARGLARDDVRLMVSYRAENRIVHTRFREIGSFLAPGDTLVINTSGTHNAALPAIRGDGTPVELHLSTHLPGDLWLVELRLLVGATSQPLYEGVAGETLLLPASGTATLHTPYATTARATLHTPYATTARATLHTPYATTARATPGAPVRLWIATLSLPQPLEAYLAEHGAPIRYSYVRAAWPNSYYQTAYVTEMGSAEMPSAGRAFTPELMTRLVARGVLFAPLLLHTGVASLERHEPPYEEYYRVPQETARLVNAARSEGRRVVAVGTTVVRALETVTGRDGIVHPGEGWTREIITPERGLRAIHGLLTGLHEPRATHLAMLEALAGRDHLRSTYAEALARRYLWHEFGDLHLLLP